MITPEEFIEMREMQGSEMYVRVQDKIDDAIKECARSGGAIVAPASGVNRNVVEAIAKSYVDLGWIVTITGLGTQGCEIVLALP